jgi:hypothetical protein
VSPHVPSAPRRAPLLIRRSAESSSRGLESCPDVILVDVLGGAEAPEPALLAALAAGQVRFEIIDAIESRVRQYGDTAVVTGRTQTKIAFGGFRGSAEPLHALVLLAGRRLAFR